MRIEMSFDAELQAALEAVKEAASLCRSVQAQIQPETLVKRDRSPVTVADYGSQALVCRRLAESFPNDSVIAEEDATALRDADNEPILSRVLEHVRQWRGVASASDVCRWIDHGFRREYQDRFWTLDPIDGTKGFLRKEQYAVSLALIIDGEIQVGAMACPNLSMKAGEEGSCGVIFLAVKGRGSTIQPLDGSEAKPIRVSDARQSPDCRFCESVESGHSSHADAASIAQHLGITADPVRLDSQAKYGMVARGDADIYLRLPTRADYIEKIWDHAGGALIVSEAGGTVTDIHGRPLEFDHGYQLSANKGVIATSGHVHDQVLAALDVLNLR
jgi:3'(2'), 5'-bisphosphate nucleotidase